MVYMPEPMTNVLLHRIHSSVPYVDLSTTVSGGVSS